MKHLILDGHNTFLRNFSVVPQMDSNGNHIGGTIGFLRSLKLCMRENSPDDVIIVWDGPGGSRFRRGIFAEYKAGRKPKLNRSFDHDSVAESKSGFEYQLQRTRYYLDLLGIPSLIISEVEADDVIGYLCRWVLGDADKVVVSTDKDFLQLIDGRTTVYSPSKKKYYTSLNFKDEYKVLPENFVIYRAIIGDDKSDNISGVIGIGPVKCLKLLPELAEREIELSELLSSIAEKALVDARYKVLVDSREKIEQNMRLMQLTSPNISTTASRAIRSALEPQNTTQPNTTALKISLIRDGIQVTDADFFQVFDEYRLRQKRRLAKNVR